MGRDAALVVEQPDACAEARPAEQRPLLGRLPHARLDVAQLIVLARSHAPLLGPLLAALGLAAVLGAARLALQIGIARFGKGIVRRSALFGGGRLGRCDRLRRRQLRLGVGRLDRCLLRLRWGLCGCVDACCGCAVGCCGCDGASACACGCAVDSAMVAATCDVAR